MLATVNQSARDLGILKRQHTLVDSDEQDEKIQAAKKSLTRIQDFNPNDLVQKDKFGQHSFEAAVVPASKITNLFKQLPSSNLDTFAALELNTVKTHADSAYNLFNEILDFDTDIGDIRNRQTQFIENIKASYQTYFTQLLPLVSYSVARTVDFNRLEGQGRAAIQSINDQTSILMKEIAEQQSEAARILNEIRKTSAERGVSEEAYHFQKEADGHKTEAEIWRTWTIRMSVAVCVYGISTLFIHKIPFIKPENSYEAVQLIAGKLIIFFVLAYGLAICARNFLSNRHNEIVNRHRQNSLMTYQSLVNAGGTPETRDVILNHAAASVYHLHDTGFTKSIDGGGNSSSSIVGLIPKVSLPTNSAG